MYLMELLAEDLRRERTREAETSRLIELLKQGGEQDDHAVRRRFSGVDWQSILPWNRLRDRVRGGQKLSPADGIRVTGPGPQEAPCESCP